MRIVFAVLLLFIAYAASYPSDREAATEDDLELELRSILNQLDEEQMTRSLRTNEDNEEDSDDDDESAFSKRQGGLNKVDKQSECEIKCIYTQRNPQSGKGKTIKEAAKACKKLCPVSAKKRGDKKTIVQRKTERNNKINVREFVDDDSNSNEEQETQRREFYDYLMEQLQRNNDE